MHAMWGRCDNWICEKWLPFGLAVLLSGFFWAPSAHSYKVIAVDLMLVPCLLAVLYWARWRDYLAKTPLLPMTLAYLAYMAIMAVVLTGAKGLEFIKWSCYVALFLVGVGLRMRISGKALTQILLLCALAAGAAGIYAVVRDVQAGTFLTYQYRLQGYATLYNAFRSGLLFGAFGAIALWCAFSRDISRWQRYAAGVIAATCLAALVLTGSRAPLLALVLIGVVVLVSYRRWYSLLLMLAISAAVTVLLWDQLFDRGASFRPQIWREVWRHYVEAPIFGVGLQRAAIKITVSNWVAYNEHNLLLAILRQGGVIGLLLYLNVAVRVIVLGWRDRARCRISYLAAILQIYGLVSLQFDGVRLITRPSDSWVLLWLPIALLLLSQRKRLEAALH